MGSTYFVDMERPAFIPVCIVRLAVQDEICERSMADRSYADGVVWAYS